MYSIQLFLWNHYRKYRIYQIKFLYRTNTMDIILIIYIISDSDTKNLFISSYTIKLDIPKVRLDIDLLPFVQSHQLSSYHLYI